MIGALLATTILIGSVGLMATAIVSNQLDPSLDTALGIPIANVISLALALLASLIAFVTQRLSRSEVLARRAVLAALIVAVALAILLPISEMGYLGRTS